MGKMLDGNSAAELANDKGEMPLELIEQARKELLIKAWNELTFDTILDALAEMSHQQQQTFVHNIKRRSWVACIAIFEASKNYISPLDEEIMQRAAEIEAENNFVRGQDV